MTLCLHIGEERAEAHLLRHRTNRAQACENYREYLQPSQGTPSSTYAAGNNCSNPCPIGRAQRPHLAHRVGHLQHRREDVFTSVIELAAAPKVGKESEPRRCFGLEISLLLKIQGANAQQVARGSVSPSLTNSPNTRTLLVLVAEATSSHSLIVS